MAVLSSFMTELGQRDGTRCRRDASYIRVFEVADNFAYTHRKQRIVENAVPIGPAKSIKT